jgi:hypothetical protein
MLTVLRRSAALQKHYRVELGEDGHPKDPEALARVAREHVIVRFGHLRAYG